MPTYEYKCDSCPARVEVIQRMTDERLTTCDSCGGKLSRVLFPVGVVYKGTGWYTTDYARKNGKGDSEKQSDSEKKSESKTEATSEGSETKADAKKSDGGTDTKTAAADSSKSAGADKGS